MKLAANADADTQRGWQTEEWQPGIKAKVALLAIRGEATIADLVGAPRAQALEGIAAFLLGKSSRLRNRSIVAALARSGDIWGA